MENQPKARWSWGGVKPIYKALLFAAVLAPIFTLVYLKGWIPGLHSEESKKIGKANIQNEAVDETTSAKKLPVPELSDLEFADVSGRTQIRLMQYTWFGNAPLFAANGGLRTMKGTLMDKAGLDFRLTTDNMTGDMRAQQLAFIAAYSKGSPTSNPDAGVQLVTQMGDGATSYIPTMNKNIVKAYGEKYKVKGFFITGFSAGEDCGIAPKEWANHPDSLRGSVWVGVIGDGDYDVVVRKFSGDGPYRVNPDPGTYDPDAINWVPAPEDDFMKAAQEVIRGAVYTLKVKDSHGRLDGTTIRKKARAAATWFPGDRLMMQKTDLIKLVSTADYPTQMATVVIGCDEWLKNHSDDVVKFIGASLTAANQIKQYDEWFKYATALAPKVFSTPGAPSDETAADWYKYAKPLGAMMKNTDGVDVSVGGTRMANLADNYKYFGMQGKNGIYRSVFEYMNTEILTKLNPADFKNNTGGVVSYEDAIDTAYLAKVKIEAGETEKVDFSKNTGRKLGTRTWHIEFESGQSTFKPDAEKDLNILFSLVNTADQNARVTIVGFTDNTGNATGNEALSLLRAKAVKKWLIAQSKGDFDSEKFSIDGKGSDEAVGDNSTSAGRAQNRRVVVTLTN